MYCTRKRRSGGQKRRTHDSNGTKDTGQSCDPGLNRLQHPTLKCDVLFGSHGDAGEKETMRDEWQEKMHIAVFTASH